MNKSAKSYRLYIGTDDVEIRVGKSAACNDELTRTSAALDWWLHVEGHSGSHVVIRAVTVSREILMDAAILAAAHSKAQGNVSVTYTQCRNVVKNKRAKPGAVTLLGDVATIKVNVGKEMHRLRRLEDSRCLLT